MHQLTVNQINRVQRVTDSLGLKRVSTIVLLATKLGSEIVLPDGSLLISAPSGVGFDWWFQGLRERLLALDLSHTPVANGTETLSHFITGQLHAFHTQGPLDNYFTGRASVDLALHQRLQGREAKSSETQDWDLGGEA